MKKLLIFYFLLTGFYANSQLTELPITLSTPFDGDTIDENDPVFIWQSNLAAIQTDPRLSQRLTVVKLLENQTPLEGLGLNAPVFLRDELTSSTLSYSSTDHELEDNVWYAWQVSYLMNNMVISQSEAWKFIRVKPIEVLRYIQLRRQNDASTYTSGFGYLGVSLDYQGQLNLNAEIIKPDGSRVACVLQEMVNGEPVEEGAVLSSKAIRYFRVEVQGLTTGIHKFVWKNPGITYTINFRKP